MDPPRERLLQLPNRQLPGIILSSAERIRLARSLTRDIGASNVHCHFTAVAEHYLREALESSPAMTTIRAVQAA